MHWLHSLQSIETYSKSTGSYRFIYDLYGYLKVNGVLGELDEKQINEKDKGLRVILDEAYKQKNGLFDLDVEPSKLIIRKNFDYKRVTPILMGIDEENMILNPEQKIAFVMNALKKTFRGSLWMFKEWGGASIANFVMEELYPVIGKICTRNNTDGTELSENLYRYFGGYAPRLRYNLDNSIKIGTYSFTIWIDRVWVLLLENIATSLTFMGQDNTLIIKLYDQDKHLKRD